MIDVESDKRCFDAEVRSFGRVFVERPEAAGQGGVCRPTRGSFIGFVLKRDL